VAEADLEDELLALEFGVVATPSISSRFSNPFDTPSTMLAMRARTVP
jgi:hypothetical protein